MNDRTAIFWFVCIVIFNMAVLAWAVTEALEAAAR